MCSLRSLVILGVGTYRTTPCCWGVTPRADFWNFTFWLEKYEFPNLNSQFSRFDNRGIVGEVDHHHVRRLERNSAQMRHAVLLKSKYKSQKSWKVAWNSTFDWAKVAFQLKFFIISYNLNFWLPKLLTFLIKRKKKLFTSPLSVLTSRFSYCLKSTWKKIHLKAFRHLRNTCREKCFVSSSSRMSSRFFISFIHAFTKPLSSSVRAATGVAPGLWRTILSNY